MEATYLCRAASSERPNEDYVLASEDFVVVLDGATAPAGVNSGCVHDVPWLVAHLAANLASLLATSRTQPLTAVLRQGIEATMADHGDSCDLSNRDSPSATVALLRDRGDSLDYAVLGDCAIVVERADGELVVAHDDRTSRLDDYSVEGVSRARNTEGGFWVASIRPEAAERAISGSLPRAEVTRAALVTDGLTRLVERYGHSWGDLLERLDACGPLQLVTDVRAEERTTAPGAYRGKQHDDVTAVLCRF